MKSLAHLSFAVLCIALSVSALMFTQAVVTPPEKVAELPKACTTEQALMWWTRAQDLQSVKKRLCSKQ